MAYEPCQNPLCNSYGKPHPNCRCYGSFAQGGEANKFCSKNNAHNPACELFKERPDPNHQVTGFLVNQGLHGLLNLDSKPDLQRYEKYVHRGNKDLDANIDALFSDDKPEKKDHSKAKEQIDQWIKNGGITQDIQQEIYNQNGASQNFAKGGEVKGKESKGVLHKHPVADVYPEQNMLLQAAKGRMSNYLNGIRPQEHLPKLAFDDAPDQTQSKKSYDKALGLAAHPMGILDEIRKGTIEPEDVHHFVSLHPDLGDMVHKKLTDRIVKGQFEGKKPSFKVRQGLSMALGVPLSSELVPSAMMAAQGVFQQQNMARQQSAPASQKKKGTSKSSLTHADQQFLTSEQARVVREQKS